MKRNLIRAAKARNRTGDGVLSCKNLPSDVEHHRHRIEKAKEPAAYVAGSFVSVHSGLMAQIDQ